MRNPRRVTMVTVSASALKTAFRKTFPDKSATELYPVWCLFWSRLYPEAKVEQVTPVKVTEDPSLPLDGEI